MKTTTKRINTRKTITTKTTTANTMATKTTTTKITTTKTTVTKTTAMKTTATKTLTMKTTKMKTTASKTRKTKTAKAMSWDLRISNNIFYHVICNLSGWTFSSSIWRTFLEFALLFHSLLQQPRFLSWAIGIANWEFRQMKQFKVRCCARVERDVAPVRWAVTVSTCGLSCFPGWQWRPPHCARGRCPHLDGHH